MKTISIVFNDETTQEQVDQIADLITLGLEMTGVTAVITVEEEQEGENGKQQAPG